MENEFDFSNIADFEIEEFAIWLSDLIKQPENAQKWARHIVETHDWSAGFTVEVPSHATKDGRPLTYKFLPSINL